MLVLDASALAGWLMPDEAGVDLAGLAAQHPVFAAPWLLWAEIRNILIVAERRGRIGPWIVEQALEAIDDLGIVLDTAPSPAALLALCRTHRLTVYDGPYLDLAVREGATLATRETARAASSEVTRSWRGRPPPIGPASGPSALDRPPSCARPTPASRDLQWCPCSSPGWIKCQDVPAKK